MNIERYLIVGSMLVFGSCLYANYVMSSTMMDACKEKYTTQTCIEFIK